MASSLPTPSAAHAMVAKSNKKVSTLLMVPCIGLFLEAEALAPAGAAARTEPVSGERLDTTISGSLAMTAPGALVCSFVLMLAISTAQGCLPRSIVHPDVAVALCDPAGAQNVEAMIRLADTLNLDVFKERDMSMMDRAARREFVKQQLVNHAERTQRDILAVLSSAGVESTPFWIVNALHVRNLTLATARQLLNAVDGIAKIDTVGRVRRMAPVSNPKTDADHAQVGYGPRRRTPPPPGPSPVQWNIKLIGADQCWKKAQLTALLFVSYTDLN